MNIDEHLKQEDLEREEINANLSLEEANIKLIGSRTTVCLIVLLLAYIRHAIRNNEKADINVKIGNNIVNSKLLFDVNGLEIDDYVTLSNIEIN